MQPITIKHFVYVLTLLCGFSVYGQQKPATAFKLFFEKPYIHTDRNVYVQGEDVWFKASLVSGQGNTLINTSGNLYVEFKDPNTQIVSKKTVRLDDGLGNGDFKLADTIPAGNYCIRAYTNWMRNFGDNFIFEKGIATLSASVLTDQKGPDIILNKTKKRKASDDGAETVVANAPVVRFYPECGSNCRFTVSK